MNITPKPHYAQSYEALVADFSNTMPLDDAMAVAVGGSYEHIGAIERKILGYAGLAPGASVIDVGCGSGRLASQLGSWRGQYLGVDVVQQFLDYAASRSPAHFRFALSLDLAIPVPDASADIVCFFSVLTHLTQVEGYCYLVEAARVLKPGGRLIVSILELAHAGTWPVFMSTVASERDGTSKHLNTFTERPMVEAIARNHGLTVVAFIPPDQAPWGGPALGQSVAILQK